MNKFIGKLKEYWKDAVWSKVIATGIVFMMVTIYSVFQNLYSKISFKDTFLSIIKLLKTEINLEIWFLTLVLSIFIIFTIKPIINFFEEIYFKAKSPKKIKVEKEKPTSTQHSTVMFLSRMANAFPGIRDLTWFDNPIKAINRLELLLKEPLEYKNGIYDCDGDPIWWFRGHSALQIIKFKKLGKNKILLNGEQLKIKKIAAYHGDSYFRDFVYIETYAEKQIGIYHRTKEEIKQRIESYGYCYEEYALIKYLYFWKKAIKREDYEDGATVIRGKVVNAENAELRVRYLSNYNFIISSKGSPYNCNKFDDESKNYFDSLLTGEIQFEVFLEFLIKLHKR